LSEITDRDSSAYASQKRSNGGDNFVSNLFERPLNANSMDTYLIENPHYYPIKALAEVDNTCRWAVGFTPTGSEPGICPVPATPTPIVPGTISGVIFHN
jgi:hypothetical protein